MARESDPELAAKRFVRAIPKVMKLLLFFGVMVFGCGKGMATSYYSVFSLKLKTPFQRKGLSCDEALQKLVTQFVADNPAERLTKDFIVADDALRKRVRGLPFKSEELVFGVALTELLDAYGLTFRLAGDALVVFDPVTDVVSDRYDGFVSIPDALKKKEEFALRGGEQLTHWLQEKGLEIWSGEEIGYFDGRNLLCKGRLRLRSNLVFVLQQAAGGE